MPDKRSFERRTLPILGRDKELEVLGGFLRSVQKGEGSRFISVVGEAGIGKTRLIDGFIESLNGRGVSVLVGKCLFQETSMPYLPFIDILSTYISKKAPARKDGGRYNLPVGLTGLEDVDTDDRAELKGLLKDVPSILSKLTDKDFRDEREWMFSTISKGIRDLGKDGPVVLFLDDFHYADKASIQLLDHLVHRMKGERFLFIVAYRPEELATSSTGPQVRDLIRRISSERLLTELALKRLTKADTRSMVLAIVDLKDAPEKFLSTIHKETGGNPYFLEEIMNHLIEEGKVVVGDLGTLRKIEPRDVHVPEIISDLVLRRVDSLGPEHKKVLQAASVIGDPFNLELLRDVVGLQEDALVDIIEDLMRLSLISEDVKGDGDLFRFNQTMTRNVLYSGLSTGRKRLLHKQVGLSLEKLMKKRTPQTIFSLANHFAIAHVPDKAVLYNTLSGDKATASYAAEDAVAFYQQAYDFLDHLPGGEEIENRRVVLLLKIADLYRLIGKWDNSLDYYTQMVTAAKALDDDGMVGLALRKKGHIEYHKGNWDEADRLMTEALRMAKESKDEIAMADCENFLGMSKWRRGANTEAIKHLQEALRIAEPVNDYYLTGRIYTELGNVHSDGGEFAEAEACYKKALEFFEPIDELLSIARVNNNIGVVWGRLGDWGRSLEHVHKSVKLYELSGAPYFIVRPLLNLSVCYSKVGMLKDARSVLARLDEMLEGTDDKLGQSALELEYGIMHRFSKEWKKAEDRLTKAVALFSKLQVPVMEATSYEELGKMYAAKGDADNARNALMRARDIHSKNKFDVNVKSIDALLELLKNGRPLPP